MDGDQKKAIEWVPLADGSADPVFIWPHRDVPVVHEKPRAPWKHSVNCECPTCLGHGDEYYKRNPGAVD